MPTIYSEQAIGTATQDTTYISPEEALSSLQRLRKDQRVVVDFDQTLFLANSSQEFIRMAKPYLFGSIIYKLLERLKPWAWFANGKDPNLTRDWFHVWAVTIFFPWTWILWRSKARKMAELWTNQPLADVLRDRDPYLNVLSSQGFGPIVRPVLRHMGVLFGKVDACSLFRGYADRRFSKVKRVRGMIGETALRRCAVITDSEEDSELLQYCEVPLLLLWPVSPVLSVTSHYMPYYYMYKVKHKGFAPILRDILFVDLMLLLLAFTWISPIPWIHGIGITCFFMSFLLIYEIGYMENDEVAFELETDPVLGSNFEEKRDYISYVEPWFWAAILAVAGAGVFTVINLLSAAGLTEVSSLSVNVLKDAFFKAYTMQACYLLVGTWALILISQRIVFRLYNYADKMTRTWINPFLQSFKSIVFVFISPINLVGAVALFCQAMSRSFGYFLYRWSRKDWPGDEVYLVRFLMYPASLLMISHALGGGYKNFFTLQSLVIAVWISSRAVKPMVRAIRKIKHVSKDDWKKIKT